MRSVKRLQTAAIVQNAVCLSYEYLIYTAIAKNKLWCRRQGNIMTIIDDDDDAESWELAFPRSSNDHLAARVIGLSLRVMIVFTCDFNAYLDIPEPTYNEWSLLIFFERRGTAYIYNLLQRFPIRRDFVMFDRGENRLHIMRFSFSHVMTFVV